MVPAFIYIICGSILLQYQYASAAAIEDINVTEAPFCRDGEFRCSSGVCVDGGSRCNGTAECPDNSDEALPLCRIKRSVHNKCSLPPFPENGLYVVYDGPDIDPGVRLDVLQLNFSCKRPYMLVGNPHVHCHNGKWSDDFPACKTLCKLRGELRSTEYRCLLSNEDSEEGFRECNYREPEGTRAVPVCRRNYHYPGTLMVMECRDWKWDYIPLCIPECGRVTPKGTELIASGWLAESDELPWHAAIYHKPSQYQQICGGSIISNKVIISAAHCFWNGTLQPPSNYAVGAGKLSRLWMDPGEEEHAQHRDVLDIIIPPRYQGVLTRFQDDIALVMLARGLLYSNHVRPVCLDFDPELDAQQLKPANLGKVAGWGLTEDGVASPALKVVELPYVSTKQCIEETPFQFKSYITSDKICAGYRNGTAVCKGDSGGGLSFPDTKGNITRYYLRGLVSTAPGSADNTCNAFTITTFTNLLKHNHFIISFFTDFENSGFKYFSLAPVPTLPKKKTFN